MWTFLIFIDHMQYNNQTQKLYSVCNNSVPAYCIYKKLQHHVGIMKQVGRAKVWSTDKQGKNYYLFTSSCFDQFGLCSGLPSQDLTMHIRTSAKSMRSRNFLLCIELKFLPSACMHICMYVETAVNHHQSPSIACLGLTTRSVPFY